MARNLKPRHKTSRRFGENVADTLKESKKNYPPGMHGPKKTFAKTSEFGRQLKEKQKAKVIYGILEKQFRKYVEKALKSKGNTGEALLVLLEKRLDNVVYKLGFATTRPMSRQLVSHRHVLVNSKIVNIPSYQVKAGDVVSLSSKIIEMPLVKKLISDDEYQVPEWLERKVSVGKIVKDPVRSDIVELVSEQDIVEFYSR